MTTVTNADAQGRGRLLQLVEGVNQRGAVQARSRRAVLHTWARALVTSLAVAWGCLVSAPAHSAGTPDELGAYALEWARQNDFSGSWRVQRGGELLAEGSRGFVRGGSGAPITADTVFWIASVSKQFAAVALLRLAEQGRVELGAPLTRYLPELVAGAVRREGVECSIEHVLSHTCGLERDAGSPFEVLGHLSEPEQAAHLFERANQHELAFKPGTDFLYSNLGYSLLGLVVQRASGKAYEQYLEEELWRPLGMRHTGIRLREGLTLARGLTGAVFGWVDAADWMLLDVEGIEESGAEGNIYSTPRDLLAWSNALHHGQLLEPASYAELTRPRLKDYGLGLQITNEVFGKLLHHNGALSPQGYSSQIGYAPDSDLSVAVLTNRPLGAGHEMAFASALLRRSTGNPEKAPVKASPWRRFVDSQPVLWQVLFSPWVIWMLYRRVWHRKALDRQSWWLSYHAHALLISFQVCFYRTHPLDPLLLLWGGIILLGAYKSRWWTLPSWKRAAGSKATAVLALRCAWLLLQLYVAPQPILWVFAVLVVAEGAFFAAVALQTPRQAQAAAAP